MDNKDRLGADQLYSLLTLLLLCPALRLFPGSSVRLAGRGAWVCGVLVFPVMLGYMCLLEHLTGRDGSDGGIYTLIRDRLPLKAGKAVLILSGLWFILYGGFILRSGADRLISAVYPDTDAPFFVITLALPALLGAMGSISVTARAAKLMLPVVGVTGAVIILSAAGGIKAENLLPLSSEDIPGIIMGIVPASDVLSLPVYMSVFLNMYRKKGEKGQNGRKWLIISCIMLSAISISVTGFFGAALTQELDWPFFSLVKNISFFKSVDRAEALVVALWIFTDFVAVSLAMRVGSLCISAVTGERKRTFLLCSGACCIPALVMAPDKAALALWSEELIPAVNMFFGFVYLPGVLCLTRRREKQKEKRQE